MTTIKPGDRVLDTHPWTLYGTGTVTEVYGDGVNVRFDNFSGYQSPKDSHYRGPEHFTLVSLAVEPLTDREWELLGGYPNEPIFRSLVESGISSGKPSVLGVVWFTQ